MHISESAQRHLLRYVHVVDMLRMCVSHRLENITVSRNSEFHVASLPVKLYRHHKLILKPGKLTGVMAQLMTAKSPTRMDARTPRGCERWSDEHSDSTRSNL